MADDWFEKYSGLDFERRDNGVLWITIDRPDAFNATDADLHLGLSRIWLDIDDDDDTRVVVITGRGKAFSAGGDMNWINSFVGDADQLQRVMREAGDVVYNMLKCSKVIISAINGVAVGAGLAIALMADVSLMAEEARITDGHVRMGVAAGDHAVILWPLLCGMAKAKYLLLLCEPVNGEQAEKYGLVSLCVEDDQLQDKAVEIANRLAAGAPSAIRWTKYALNNWYRMMGPAFDASTALEMLGFAGPEVREGLASHLEKRKPVFDPKSPI